MIKLVLLSVMLGVALADPEAYGRWGGKSYGGGHWGGKSYGGKGSWRHKREAEADAVAESDADADSYFYNAYYPSVYGYGAGIAHPALYSAYSYGHPAFSYGHPAYRIWKREAEPEAYGRWGGKSYGGGHWGGKSYGGKGRHGW